MENTMDIESEVNENTDIQIKNMDGIEYLGTIDNNSVDLILTDPPYITSSDTGMGDLHKQIEENKANCVVV